MQFTDSHTHLDSKEFDTDRDEVVARAHEAGVTRLITIGASDGLTSARTVTGLTEKYSGVWASVGVHPQDASIPLDVAPLRELASHPKVVAIGETGLDFFKEWSPRESQFLWFRAQVELALSVKKPIVIHSRNAGEECIKLLEEMGAKEVGGVFHCFAENEHFAARLAKINFLVSFPGTLTFKKAENVRAVAKAVPLSQIMIETDAPYMAPEPNRGKRCESAFVVETAKTLAKIKELSVEEIAAITSANATRLFKLI